MLNGGTPLPSPTQAHHLDATLRADYKTDLFEVDIKLEKYAQSVYSTSQNPHGTVVGRKFFSHLKLGVTKDLTNTLPERLAQSLIPHRQKITNYLTPSKATLYHIRVPPPNISCFERPTYTRKATPSVWLRLCETGTGEDPCR